MILFGQLIISNFTAERIAAETTGRVCFGVELNPAYVDVAVERWQSFTGQEAVLVETRCKNAQ